jgi:hypothetical protein
VLEYLAQFDDPARVNELIGANTPKSSAADELKTVERDLKRLDDDFQANLALLKRGVLDDADFVRANDARKDERKRLELRRDTLQQQRQASAAQEALMTALPARIRSFVTDVQAMEPRRAKGLLQEIIATVTVHRDGRVELEFRT